jgi:hypothetical protein
MSRYYGYVVFDFMDGTTDRVGGNDFEILKDGTVLQVFTRRQYGDVTDRRWFPLANIKSWRWDD